MDTKEIMELSLKLAVLKEIPEDSAIYISGDNIGKALFGIRCGCPRTLARKAIRL